VDGVTLESAQAAGLTPSSARDGVRGFTPKRESDSVSRPPYRKRTESKTTGSQSRRLALTVTEAAEALGVSPDFFAEHIGPELRVVRRGRKKLIAVRELEQWLDRSAGRTLE